MADILKSLEAGLSGRYAVERELGHGGTAWVFLAQDLKHHRNVALKVLRPELAAALGSERFLREIEIAARLTHPHILTLHDSGEVRDASLLYYVMPFVEGESLRQRLDHERQLPVEDALQIAREVADALAYAHTHDVVHRDIKPENILLSGGHALVADFGIARAISAAGGDRLTATGIAVGTPVYMSPEQASGQFAVDGRSDVYSLGCVLYEALTGEPPFTGPTAQAVVARHMTDPVPPLRTVRKAVPATIERAVTKALEKAPADRYRTAGEFGQALASPSGARAPRRVPRGVLAAAGAALALVALAVGLTVSRTAVKEAADSAVAVAASRKTGAETRVVLADVAAAAPDSSLGEAVSVALRVDLARSPVVDLLPITEIQQTLTRMRRDPSQRLDASLAREVALREGADAVVAGEIQRVGPAYLLSVSLLSAADGSIVRAWRETAVNSSGVIGAVERLTQSVRREIGEPVVSVRAGTPLAKLTTASLEALQKQGLCVRAFREGELARAASLCEEATRIDTAFATAYILLSITLANLGVERPKQQDAIARAYRHRDRLPEGERDQVIGMYHADITGDHRQAVQAFRNATELDPRQALWPMLAHSLLSLSEAEEAERVMRQALRVKPTPATYWELVRALVAQGRSREAWVVLRDGERAYPRHPFMPELRVDLLAATGDYAAADSMAASLPAELGGSRLVKRARLATVQGKLEEALGYLRAVMDDYEATGLSSEAAVIGIERGELRVLAGDTAGALEEVAAALRGHPLASLHPLARPYLSLAVFDLEVGRPNQAVVQLDRYVREVPAEFRGGDRWLEELVRAGIIRATAPDITAELEHLRAALYRLPTSLEVLAELGRAYQQAGARDSAIAVYRRYADRTDLNRLEPDAFNLADVLGRLGRLHEEAGERALAVERYRQLVRLWQAADPVLLARLEPVRQALAR